MKHNKFLVLFLAVISACGPEKNSDATPVQKQVEATVAVPEIEFKVVATIPHDTTAFTEGYLFYNGQLLESTGSPNGSNFKSVLGPVDMTTGKITPKAELDASYFGEGIVVFKNKIYQLTYEDQVGFIYDARSYKKTGQFNYANKQGWGMTTDSSYIIMSDGTELLTYFDETFKPVKTLTVTENGFAKESLNELEYIKGFIYANVWMTGEIVKIDPATGKIVARLNLTALSYDVKNMNPSTYEMNGIAYDPATDKIFVTGKAWPKSYEISFPH